MPYSEITITAPSSAKRGDTVQFSLALKNVSSIARTFKMECWAPDQSPGNKLFDSVANIPAGQTVAWPPATFIMPNYNAQIFVWVEVWTGSDYNYDNSKLKEILLSVLQPTISEFKISNYYKV